MQPQPAYTKIDSAVGLSTGWTTGQCIRHCRAACLHETGISLAVPAEIPSIYELAISTIEADLTLMDELYKVYEKNNCAFFVVYEGSQDVSGAERLIPEIAAFLAILFLAEEGEAAIREGSFDPHDIDVDWLVGNGDMPSAMYTWSTAASSRSAGRKIVRLSRRVSHEMFDHIGQYCFGATPMGCKMLETLGYYRMTPDESAARPGTYYRPPGRRKPAHMALAN